MEEMIEDTVAAKIETEATPAEDLLEVNAAEQILRRISFDTSKAPSVMGSAFLRIREDRLCFLDTLTLLPQKTLKAATTVG
jgi:hypothetical protein